MDNHFAFDLETVFMKKGYKRHQTIIVSIGAIHLYSARSFHCFVKPSNCKSIEDVYEYFQENGARLDSSKEILEKIKYEFDKALSIKTALYLFKQFTTEKCILTAHNGNAFDFKILEGNCIKEGVKFDFVGLDSLHYICKKSVKLQSYSLGNIYKHVVENKQNLKWHTALDDSIGLKQVLQACSVRFVSQFIDEMFKIVRLDLNTLYDVNLKDHTLTTEERNLLKKFLKKSISCIPDIIQNKILIFCIKKWSKK